MSTEKECEGHVYMAKLAEQAERYDVPLKAFRHFEPQDAVASRMLTKELLKHLKMLCAHTKPEVQQYALLAVGNLAFCQDNRSRLAASGSLREMLLHLSVASNPSVSKAAVRALAIFGQQVPIGACDVQLQMRERDDTTICYRLPILVMQDGEIKQAGSYSDLLQASDVFQKLAAAHEEVLHLVGRVGTMTVKKAYRVMTER